MKDVLGDACVTAVGIGLYAAVQGTALVVLARWLGFWAI